MSRDEIDSGADTVQGHPTDPPLATARTQLGVPGGGDIASAQTQAGTVGPAASSSGGIARASARPGDTRPDLEALPDADPAHYTVGLELGRGGMGRVLVARDRKLRRNVVVKVLHNAAYVARFEREALITARLQHPSIVRVYDAGRLYGEPFYTMEHVLGMSLDRKVAAAEDAKARLALLPHVIAIADALAYAHDAGVIHRDLKPANVLVGDFGQTIVIDWGLAKDLTADVPEPVVAGDAPSPAVSGDLTMVGSVMGTPAYMPPEQARGEPADKRSDVYVIGAILYTVLSGTPPVSGERALEDARAGGIQPLRERAPETPDELVTIVEHAMAFDPADRYANAGELAEELRRFAAGKLVARHAYSTGALIRRWIKRYRAPLAVAAVALVVLGVLAFVGIRTLVTERDRADAAAADATAARFEAEDKSDNVAIHQAQRALAADPSHAIAWLQRVSARGLERARVRELAADAATQGIAFELAGPTDDIEHVVVAGGLAYTGGDDGRLWRWQPNAFRGEPLAGHTGPIEAVAITQDGFTLATGGTDGRVLLWDLFAVTHRPLAPAHTATVRGLAFSPDGNTLASVGQDHALWLWTVATATGKKLLAETQALRSVAWSADGAVLWVGTNDGRILAIEPATGKVTATLRAHVDEVRVLAPSPDGTRLASGGEDGAVVVWTLADRAPHRVGSHADVVRDLVWTSDSRTLVSAGGDPIVRAHDVHAGTFQELRGNTSGVKDLALSPDDTTVASAGIDGKVRLWRLAAPTAAPRVLAGHRASVKAVAFTANGATLISGSDDDRLRLWPLAPPPPPPASPDAFAAWLVERTNLTVAPP